MAVHFYFHLEDIVILTQP